MWDKLGSTCGCQVVFPGVLPFSPRLLIDSARYELNKLERDVKLNNKMTIEHLSNQCCHITAAAIDQIHFKLVSNEDNDNNSDEFEFCQDQT